MAIVISVTIIEAYFVLFGGFFLVAFAGSSWTKSYWEKYLSYVVAVGVRLFFTALILGVLQTTWKDNSWVPKSASEITELPFNLLSMLMVLTLDVVLMVTLPSKAAALMNGAVQAGLGEVMGGAALALSGGKALANPTSAVAGIAKDGIKAAVAAPGGAKKAAYSAMREGLKNNIGGAKDGDLSKFRQSIKDTGQKASSKNTKEGLSNLKDSSINKWKDAAQKSSNSVSTFANKANAADATHSGGSVNVNPHNH